MANISETNEQDVIQSVGKHTVSDVRYEWGCVTIQVGRPHDAMDGRARHSFNFTTTDTTLHRKSHWCPAGHPQYTSASKGRLWVARPHTLVARTTQVFNIFLHVIFSFFHFVACDMLSVTFVD